MVLSGRLGDATVAGTITGVGLLPRLYDGYDVGLYGILANVIVGLVVLVATRGRLGIPASPTRHVTESAPLPVAG